MVKLLSYYRMPYLDFFFSKRDLVDEFETRRLVGLWVALVCVFQNGLILSAAWIVRIGPAKCPLIV